MKEIEISAYCYSEKQDVGIGFGTFFNPEEETVQTLGKEWIEIGVSESFWENVQEFEPGVKKAKEIIKENPNITYKQALYNIFGDFSISYEMEGEKVSLELEIDTNQAMYDLLLEI